MTSETMNTIFTQTSDGLYDRHQYKVITSKGDYIFEGYDDMRMFWWHHKDIAERVEILDVTKGKGF